VGDFRNYSLMDAFYAAVELHRAETADTVSDLAMRLSRASQNERELSVAPKFFDELARCVPRMGRHSVRLKAGGDENELTLFRYDVVISVGKPETLQEPDIWIRWDEGAHWECELRERLADPRRLSIGIQGFPDRRVMPYVSASRALRHGASDGAVTDLWSRPSVGYELSQLDQLAEQAAVQFELREGHGDVGEYEVIFNPRWAGRVGVARSIDAVCWPSLVNRPARWHVAA